MSRIRRNGEQNGELNSGRGRRMSSRRRRMKRRERNMNKV